MLDNRVNKKINSKLVAPADILKNQDLPHLSLNLHTMPQTADSHFKKWLFLACLVFALMILGAVLIFWR